MEIYALKKSCSFNNYFIFSTTTFGGSLITPHKYLLSYGFFGTVKTTANIDHALSDLDKFIEEFKRTH